MKNIIIQEIADIVDTPYRRAGIIVEAVLKELKQGIVNDGKVTIRGFGSFHAVNKNQRLGRNPKTGKDAVISARRVTIFKASKKFKAKINNGDPYA